MAMAQDSKESFYHTTTHHTESLETCIRHRHAIRDYLPDPVPTSVLHSCLALAQLSPSNSNIQNWRLFIASGSRRDSIVSELFSTARAESREIPPLPESFRHFRSELGHELYGPRGYNIPREDKAGHQKAVMRNFEFFGAPTIAVVAQDRNLAPVDAMGVGMYMQTLMLALTEQGLGTCAEVSVTAYPEVLKKGFGIPEDLVVLCGIAIGW